MWCNRICSYVQEINLYSKMVLLYPWLSPRTFLLPFLNIARRIFLKDVVFFTTGSYILFVNK